MWSQSAPCPLASNPHRPSAYDLLANNCYSLLTGPLLVVLKFILQTSQKDFFFFFFFNTTQMRSLPCLNPFRIFLLLFRYCHNLLPGPEGPASQGSCYSALLSPPCPPWPPFCSWATLSIFLPRTLVCVPSLWDADAGILFIVDSSCPRGEVSPNQSI